MTGKRRRYGADFKAKVALEACVENGPLATERGIHLTMADDWKRQAMDWLASIFSDRSELREMAESPRYGSRQMTRHLRREVHTVGRNACAG